MVVVEYKMIFFFRCLLECTWEHWLSSHTDADAELSCLPLGVYLPEKNPHSELPICRHAKREDSELNTPGDDIHNGRQKLVNHVFFRF